MKRFTHCICILLVCVMMFSTTAFAAETAEPKGSSYFMNSSVFLCNVSGNSFEAWFEVTAVSRMEAIGVNYIKIQRSTDGSNWTTVKTYTKESYPHLLDSNSVSHSAGVSYTATGGYYYRAVIQLYAKKGIGSAIMNEYTSKIYIPAN